MYFALFAVAFGSAVTLGQAAALFHLLDLENYVDYRVVLNTMNVAAPFLCLGFDSSAPVLRRMNPGFPYFWNLLFVQLATMVLLVNTALFLPAASELVPLVMGLAAATSVAAALLIANHYRAEGAIRRYFISINIVDKSVRTIIILGLAVLVHDMLLWSIMVSVFCFAYVGLIASKTGFYIKLDVRVFLSHLRTSISYIFAALGIVVVTRMPFYAGYFFEEKLFTAKIDIWLLFSLFILIPVLNKSKIEEANSTGLVQKYISAMKQSWMKLLLQEMLICTFIIGLAVIAVLLGRVAQTDMLRIVLPLMIGMILISSQPNYVHVLCFASKFAVGIKISLLIAVTALLAYLPRLAMVEFPVPWLFVLSGAMYCAIGCMVTRLLDVQIADFWRWRNALLLSLYSTLALMAADILIDKGIL